MRFLDDLAREILDQDTDLERMCIILPSQRSILYLRKSLSRNIEKPIFLPKMYTLDGLARELSGLTEPDSVVASLELYQSYQHLYPESASFQEFLAWSGSILRDFNTVDTYLIDVPQLYSDLKNLKEINEWSFLEEELGADQIKFNKFWQKLGPLYAEFNSRLSAKRLSYSGAIMRQAGENISHPWFRSYERFFMAGFNALSPAEIRIIDHIHEASHLTILWDASPFMISDADDPAGLFINRWKKKAWNHQFPREGAQNKKHFQFIGHPHGLSQARWAGGLLGEKDKQEQHTAIVLADESLLEPLLDSFPEEFREINISIGLSIKTSIIYQVIEAYYRLHSRAAKLQQTRGRYTFHAEDVRIWAEMAAGLQVVHGNSSKRLERWTHSTRRVFIDPAELHELLEIELLFEPCGRNEFLKNLLEILEEVDSDDKLVVSLRQRLIDSLAYVQEVVNEYSFIEGVDEVWHAVRSTLGKERLTYIGEPIKGLQVMGLLETRTLDFDRIIMIGANEGSLPKGRSYETFLPFDLRKHYNLPTHREEDAVFAYYFFRLMQYPSEVNIGYSLQSDDTGGGEKSRYLQQIKSGYLEANGIEIELAERIMSTPNLPSGDIVAEVKQDEITREQIKAYYAKGISFSRLSDFTKCPLDFYYRSILSLGEDRAKEDEIDSSEMGKLVHDTLEELFKVHVGQGTMSPIHIKEMEVRLEEVFDAMLVKWKLKEISKSGESALIKSVAYEMLQNYFKREKKRLAQAEIEIVSLEEDMSLEMDLDIGEEKIDLRFVAKMDRVERNRDGVMLIDYKTGKAKSSDVNLSSMDEELILKPEKSKAFQLLYYSWFYWKKYGEVVDAGIVSMLGMDVDPIKVSIKGHDQIDQSVLEEFEEVLMDMLRRIYTSESFEHDDENGMYCTLCPEQAESRW